MAIDILTLALAKKMSGSSGGSAIQSDWNQNDETAPDYVKNRPFYESSGLEVISECEISSISSYSDASHRLYAGNVDLPSAEYVYGKEYTIEINGETHVMSLTQQLDNQIGDYFVGFNIADGATVIGTPRFNNNVLFGTCAHNYPMLSDGDTFTASLSVYLAQTVSLPATIRVGLEAETLVQLDPKYLPDNAKSDWNQNDASQPSYVKNRPFYSEFEEHTVELIDGPLEGFPSFAPGDTVTVTVDGVEHSLVAFAFEDVVLVGDNPKEPPKLGWIIVNEGGTTVFNPMADPHQRIVSWKVETAIHKLDTKYLPILEESTQTVFETVVELNEENHNEVILEEPTLKKLVGKYVVTIDGVSETVTFIEELDGSFMEGDDYFIATQDGRIYIKHDVAGTHSVKIDKINDVIKEEHLPDSVKAQPDWNANEGEPGYIKNSPFYGNIETIEVNETCNVGGFSSGYDKAKELGNLLKSDNDLSNVVVTINETEYALVYNDDRGWWDLKDGGNYSVQIDSTGTYILATNLSDGTVSGTATFTGYYKTGEIHKIDPKYLPDSAAHIETGAEVGQTIVVKAVDDNGKPTEWETRDFPDSGGGGTLLPETEISQEKLVYGFDINTVPVGEKVAVIMDGKPYITTHREEGEGADAIDWIGNIAMLAPEAAGTEHDTGEPFFAQLFGSHSTFFFADGASHKIAIYTVDALDEAYVRALNSIGNMSGGSGSFVVNVTADGTLTPTNADKTYEEIYGAIVSGMSVVAMVDGGTAIPYAGVDLDNDRILFAFNCGTYGGAEIIFFLSVTPENVWSITTKDFITAENIDLKYVSSNIFNTFTKGVAKVQTATVGQTIKVKSVGDNGVPTAWEAVDPWIITSSTEGSTKKFKLAVDDSGTITATEVT